MKFRININGIPISVDGDFSPATIHIVLEQVEETYIHRKMYRAFCS